jgi:hypothetical protein
LARHAYGGADEIEVEADPSGLADEGVDRQAGGVVVDRGAGADLEGVAPLTIQWSSTT